jgi:hypothetical protein
VRLLRLLKSIGLFFAYWLAMLAASFVVGVFIPEGSSSFLVLALFALLGAPVIALIFTMRASRRAREVATSGVPAGNRGTNESNEELQRSPRADGSSRITGQDEWLEQDFPFQHPGPDWVYASGLDSDNECKLISIREQGHRDAAINTINAVLEGKDYRLTAKREPDNAFDRNAIAIYSSVNGSADTQIGYVPREVNSEIARLFESNMPLRAIVMRIIQAPDGERYIRLGLLMPKKRLRKAYERGQP